MKNLIKIHVEKTSKGYALFTNFCKDSPAGFRLARCEPYPLETHEFLTLNEAEEAQQKLQKYLDDYYNGKRKSTKTKDKPYQPRSWSDTQFYRKR